MMMMIIITVPKSYVVSGLPLWCNKDDFTLTEPATCFRTFPGFLPPDSRPTGTAPSFPAISRVPTASLASTWRGSFLSIQFLGSCFLTTTLQLQLYCFCYFSCWTAWIASIAILFLPFISWILKLLSYVHQLHLSCLHFPRVFIARPLSVFYSSPDSIRFPPFYLVPFVRNLLFCLISVHLVHSYNVALVLHLQISIFYFTVCILAAKLLRPSLVFRVPTAWLAYQMQDNSFTGCSKPTCLFVNLFVMDRAFVCYKPKYFIWLIHRVCTVV